MSALKWRFIGRVDIFFLLDATGFFGRMLGCYFEVLVVVFGEMGIEKRARGWRLNDRPCGCLLLGPSWGSFDGIIPEMSFFPGREGLPLQGPSTPSTLFRSTMGFPARLHSNVEFI